MRRPTVPGNTLPKRWRRIIAWLGLTAVILWPVCCGPPSRIDEVHRPSAADGLDRIDSRGGPAVFADAAFNRLFTRSGPGWTGGDGTYSVPLPDGRTIWLFGDTFLGHVDSNRSRPADSPFIRNSVVVQQDHRLKTLHGRRDATPTAFMAPPEPSQWYWPADGTVAGNRLWVFFRRMAATGDGMWQWRYAATDLVSFSLPDIQVQLIRPLAAAGIRFGAAVLETEHHLYIYGTGEENARKFMYLARAPAGQPAADWAYAGENRWTAHPERSRRLLAGVANQFSVLPVDRLFCLVTMDGRAPFSNRIVAYTAPTPAGPWRGPVTLYTPPEAHGDIVAYNACAHPQFTDDDGRVLISYNLNHVSDATAIYENADLYRPRFIRVDIRKIIESFKFEVLSRPRADSRMHP